MQNLVFIMFSFRDLWQCSGGKRLHMIKRCVNLSECLNVFTAEAKPTPE